MAKKIKAKRQTKLQKLILQYTPELQEAQKRIKELGSKKSRALDRARRNKPKRRGKHGKIFTFSDIKSQRELNREITRIRTFLMSESSQRALLPKRIDPYWERFNKREQKERSEDTYRLYRMLQERFGGDERFTAIMDAYNDPKNKYESDTVLDDIEEDFSNNMTFEDIMKKWEDIFTDMETRYKALYENKE